MRQRYAIKLCSKCCGSVGLASASRPKERAVATAVKSLVPMGKDGDC